MGLNILHINKYHYIRAGAEAAYFRTAHLMEAHGHKSQFFSMKHPQNVHDHEHFVPYFMPYVELIDEKVSLISKIKIAARILYSIEAKRKLMKLIESFKIDIVHMHNIYHHISPSILHVLKKKNIPVVMTLHDYKVVCPSYSMWANNGICEDCSGGRYFNAIKNKCVKKSLSKSMLSALEMYLHNTVLDIYDNVDIFISPSLFLKSKVREMGFKKEIIYLPNFIDIHDSVNFSPDSSEGKDKEELSVVYFGRLSQEKGLLTLLKSAKLITGKKQDKRIIIKIIGDGPLRAELQAKAEKERLDNVMFFGYMTPELMCKEVKKSSVVVVPSEWYENNPFSIIEAFAMGMPVIGARIGGITELVRDNETGLLFESGNAEDLSSKIEYLVINPDKVRKFGEKAREYMEKELSADRHYEKLIQIYEKAMNRKK